MPKASNLYQSLLVPSYMFAHLSIYSFPALSLNFFLFPDFVHVPLTAFVGAMNVWLSAAGRVFAIPVDGILFAATVPPMELPDTPPPPPPPPPLLPPLLLPPLLYLTTCVHEAHRFLSLIIYSFSSNFFVSLSSSYQPPNV